jgi:hypothetical protein
MPRAANGMILTFNAEANAPVLSINTRLGFAVHERSSSYQIDRDTFAAWLAGRARPAHTGANREATT